MHTTRIISTTQVHTTNLNCTVKTSILIRLLYPYVQKVNSEYCVSVVLPSYRVAPGQWSPKYRGGERTFLKCQCFHLT